MVGINRMQRSISLKRPRQPMLRAVAKQPSSGLRWLSTMTRRTWRPLPSEISFLEWLLLTPALFFRLPVSEARRILERTDKEILLKPTQACDWVNDTSSDYPIRTPEMMNRKNLIAFAEFMTIAVLLFWPFGCRSAQPQPQLPSQRLEDTSHAALPNSQKSLSQVRQGRRIAVQNEMAKEMEQARSLYHSFGQND